VFAVFFLSNMLVMIGAWIADRVRRSVNTPSELELIAGLPVLGTVPLRNLPYRREPPVLPSGAPDQETLR
ncbi:MAG TPA: hypothetical protein VFA04_26325, partial [Bryobacteraceae bacterium]|nr:hypothetical protein [Bryobacteraceae bacterium]